MADGRSDAETNLGLPYGADSPQVTGRKVEKKVLRDRGARQHPMSGAGRIKEDGSDEDNLYEVKNANRTFNLDSRDLLLSYIRGCRAGKDAQWIIRFSNGIEATIYLGRTQPK